MRKLTLIALAALASGSLAFVGPSRSWAEDNKSDGGANVQAMNNAAHGNMQLPSGIQKSQKDDSGQILSLLSNVSEGAVKKNNLTTLVTYFSTADRNRIEPQLKQWNNDAKLNGRIDQINKDWKAKYGHDFNIDEKVVFGPQFQGFTVVQGEVTNPTLLSNWPVDNKGGSSGQQKDHMQHKDQQHTNQPHAGQQHDMSATDHAKQAGQHMKEAGKDALGMNQGSGSAQLQKGWQVALITFPASHGLPEVNVSMVQEQGGNWRFDLPDNVDGQRVYDNLLTQLTSLGEKKDQWPADEKEAYRLAAHRIVTGLYDVPMTGSSSDQPKQMMNVPNQGKTDQNQDQDAYQKSLQDQADQNKPEQPKD